MSARSGAVRTEGTGPVRAYAYLRDSGDPDAVPVCESGEAVIIWGSESALHSVMVKEDAQMDEWVCSICGCMVQGSAAPEKCPVCNAPSEAFRKQGEEAEPVKEEARQSPGELVCSRCGYISEGPDAPERCPICGAPASEFR